MKMYHSLILSVLAFSVSVSANDEVLRLGNSEVTPPNFTERISPVYPPSALNIKLQGYVILEVTCGRDGKIRDIEVLRGLGNGRFGFEGSAIAAVKQWRFEPGIFEGKPADVRMTLKIDFVLDRDASVLLESWQADPYSGKSTAPKVISPSGPDNADLVAYIKVDVHLDEENNVLDIAVDESLFSTFEDPEMVRSSLFKILEKTTFRSATREGVTVPSILSCSVAVPL